MLLNLSATKKKTNESPISIFLPVYTSYVYVGKNLVSGPICSHHCTSGNSKASPLGLQNTHHNHREKCCLGMGNLSSDDYTESLVAQESCPWKKSCLQCLTLLPRMTSVSQLGSWGQVVCTCCLYRAGPWCHTSLRKEDAFPQCSVLIPLRGSCGKGGAHEPELLGRHPQHRPSADKSLWNLRGYRFWTLSCHFPSSIIFKILYKWLNV